jgi:ATP-binding cassette subfamily F protein uup
LLAQEEVWIRQGVEARRTRSVARISRLEDLRQTRAQRRDAVGQVKLDISSGQRSGKIVAVLEDVDLSFGEKVIIKGFTSTLLRGDKIGILGPNGAGKSTLLKVILGVLQPQSGVVKLGTQIEVAYFDQMRESLDLESNLEDFISPGSEWVEISGQRKHVKSYLNDFLFSPERARSPIKSLSGGERNRLLLARLFAKPANVLVLDEPTNDLDIDTLDLLEEFLQNYSGTVFLVSHDRQFLDHVVTSMIAFEGDGIWREYEGGYEDWKIQNQRRLDYANKQSVIDNKSIKSVENKKELKVSKETQATKKTASLSKWEKKELEELSERIDFLEKQQVLLSEKLSDPSIYSSGNEKMGELKKQIIETDEELGRINIRWELLMERNTL